MGDRDDRQHVRRSVELVTELEAMNVEIDYDVMRIGPHTWAIHGHIAYDSEVIAATFPSEQDAWIALSPLRPTRRRPRSGSVAPGRGRAGGQVDGPGAASTSG